MTKKQKAKKILELLTAEFPNTAVELVHSNVLELLIATILSAQCTDIRVNIVTKNLFKKYKTIKDYANADFAIIVNEIKSINLLNNKAKNIINMANLLLTEFNGEVPNNLDDLIKLPGVGRKTANVVLGSWFKISSGFVVDTHVKRCANRMGFSKSNNVEVIEKDLMNLFPESEWFDLASRFILHGRSTCPARRKPNQACSLGDLCVVK